MKDLIKAFDEYLREKGLNFEATVVGGAALLVMGIIDRATQDIDCLIPRIPKEIAEAAKKFGSIYSKKSGIILGENWLNNGPETLARDLPSGWIQRAVPLYQGKNLQLNTLSRFDFLSAKLFAYCDRQQDFQDCLALKPTLAELKQIYSWLILRDVNPLWPEHVKRSLSTLAERLGYEFATGR